MTKHNKKSSKEMAIEIHENERIYNKQIEDDKKLLGLKQIEYDEKVNKLNQQSTILKRNIIERAGRLLETSGFTKKHIAKKLRRDYKGYIGRDFISAICKPHGWTNPDLFFHIRKDSKKVVLTQPFSQQEPLTKQEQEYVKAAEDEYRRNSLIDELLELWTGKTKQQQAEIMISTPKGSNWRKRLAEESRDHMFKVFKQMTDSYVIGTVNDMRTIVEIATAFGDVGYEEQESRKKNVLSP